MCKSSHEVQVVFVNSLIIGYIIPARLMEVPKNNKVYECHPRELERAQHVQPQVGGYLQLKCGQGVYQVVPRPPKQTRNDYRSVLLSTLQVVTLLLYGS